MFSRVSQTLAQLFNAGPQKLKIPSPKKRGFPKLPWKKILPRGKEFKV